MEKNLPRKLDREILKQLATEQNNYSGGEKYREANK
jgi:hypothetical protein